MSCVWDSIIDALKLDTTPHNLLEKLKKENMKTVNVKWNDQMLTDKQLEDNFNRIEALTIDDIPDGYLCSSFEPLFFLLAQLFEVSIEHDLSGTIINYNNIKTDDTKKLFFTSNVIHFWADSQKLKQHKKKIKRNNQIVQQF